MLEIKNISFSYDTPILQDISFQLKQGEFLGIVGKSGGGKSSLLKIIAGYLSPNSGAVFFNKQKLKYANELLVPGYPEIAIVHQDFGLDLYHTVRENIREKVLSLPRKMQDQMIRELLDLLDLNDLSEQKAIYLSGGEQQRLSIARAFASECDLILLDEPFVHLDSPMRWRLIDYLQKLRQIRKTSFIIVTHNGEEILSLCDEVIYLKKGKVVRKNKPSHFYNSPKSKEEAAFFGPINHCKINGKAKLFRPNQFSFDKQKGEILPVHFVRSIQQGPLMHNYFITNNGEDLLLFNFEAMDNVKEIYV